MAKPIELTDTNFKTEVLDSPIPVMVDFWAEWCAPCRILTPVIEEIAGVYEGKIKIGKVNVDGNPQTSMDYQIRGIPSLLFFKNGKVMEQIIGVVPKNNIISVIDSLINLNNS